MIVEAYCSFIRLVSCVNSNAARDENQPCRRKLIMEPYVGVRIGFGEDPTAIIERQAGHVALGANNRLKALFTHQHGLLDQA